MKIWTKEQEAERLKARFEGINRAEFARQHQLPGDQSMIYQHITGRRPIGLEAAIAYAKGFNCSLGEISPRLALETSAAASQMGGQDIPASKAVTDIDLDETTIILTNAAGSMGLGYPQPDFEMIVDTMRVNRSWIRANLPAITRLDNLALLPAYGDSMAPTFSDGDLLIVDRGVREIKGDAVYVISRDDDLFIKRVRRSMQDGSIIVKSDNPLFGPDDIITNGDREKLQVLGRVVWSWGGKKI